MTVTSLTGTYGIAQLCEFERTPDQQANLVTWILKMPGIHAFWSQYILSIITLEEVPGIESAELWVPEATHEVIFGALLGLGNLPHDPTTWNFSQHCPYQFQTVGLSNDQVPDFAEELVQYILDGKVFPEPTGIQNARETAKVFIAELLVRRRAQPLWKR